MKRLINQTPAPATRVLFGLLPFVLLALAYMLASDARLAENPGRQAVAGFQPDW